MPCRSDRSADIYSDGSIVNDGELLHRMIWIPRPSTWTQNAGTQANLRCLPYDRTDQLFRKRVPSKRNTIPGDWVVAGEPENSGILRCGWQS